MKKIKLLVPILAIFVFAGCGSVSYKDGNYVGEYKGKAASSMTVKLTIKDGKIVACEEEQTDDKGDIKNENYGKTSGEANYALAQRALKATKTYPDALVKAGDINDVEAISGATVSYKEFKTAVGDALKKASE